MLHRIISDLAAQSDWTVRQAIAAAREFSRRHQVSLRTAVLRLMIRGQRHE